MTTVHDWITPTESDDPVERHAFTPRELGEHGLHHPAERQLWVAGLPGVVALMVAIRLLFFGADSGLGSLLRGIAFAGFSLGVLWSAASNLIGARLTTPDVFVGWGFRDSSGPFNVVSSRVLQIAAFIWPTWGVVSLLPPARDPLSNSREEQGFRGAQWPFILRVMDDDDWKDAAAWLIGQCRAAVFDVSSGKGNHLSWEIKAATKALGRENVLFLEKDSTGNLTVRTHRSVVRPPEETEEHEPAGVSAPDGNSFSALCAIRGWLAASLPVSRKAHRIRRSWAAVDYWQPYLSNLLLLVAVVSFIASFLV